MYDWLNNRFAVRACWEFEAGSTYELKNGWAPTTVGTPRMVPGKGLRAPKFSGSGHYLHYGDQCDITDTTQPWTWILPFSLDERVVGGAVFGRIVQKYDGAIGWILRWSSFGLGLYIQAAGGTLNVSYASGTGVASGTPSPRVVIITYNGGLRAAGVQVWIDGCSSVAGVVTTDTLTSASVNNADNLCVGQGKTSSTSLAATLASFAFLNQQITPAEAAAIYEQIQNEHAAASRPTRNYSLPYPAMTPSEYAAKGIILDTDMHVVQGKTQDFTSNGRVGTPSGTLDRVRGGPFDGATEVGATGMVTLATDSVLWRTNDWSICTWIRPRSAAQRAIIASVAAPGNYLIQENTNTVRVSTLNATPAQRTLACTGGASGVSQPGEWVHVCAGRQLVAGSDLKLFIRINGIEAASVTYPTEGVYIQGPGQTTILRSAATSSLNGAAASLRYYTRAITATEARQEFLQGARKILFDGRLLRDGSCPVMPVAVGGAGATLPGTPWTLAGAGNWKVVEDAPVAGKLGQRRIAFVSSGDYIWAPDSSAPYGSWLLTMKTTTFGGFMNFVCDRKGFTSTPLGYCVYYDNTGVLYLYRTTGGGTVVLLKTAAGYVSAGVVYEFWIARGYDNKFTFWIRGGAYTQWTLVAPANPYTNPTTADPTYTTCKYICLSRNAGTGEYGDVVHYLG